MAPLFRHGYVQCLSPSGLHRMSYTDWGAPDNPRVVVCVHGLTRNGRDFDRLAATLATRYRVICPDVVGRGGSDYLSDPQHYQISQYVSDMVTLLARVNVPACAWVGTSMGGLIGMALASLPNSPINRLLLNDVGPYLSSAALNRIAGYVGQNPAWPSYAAAKAEMAAIFAGFGPLTVEDWEALSRHALRQDAAGLWRFNYDPAIAQAFRQAFTGAPIDLWPIYERIACPVWVIRGALSDLLDREVWLAMATRGPGAELRECPEVGHAPMFMRPEEIQMVAHFLES